MVKNKVKRVFPRRFPDEFDNERFNVWHKQRQQCLWRGEAYELTIEDFFALWPRNKWRRRGRGRTQLCLTRKDRTQPWSLANCELVTRLEQLTRTAKSRIGKPRRSRKKPQDPWTVAWRP